jgi:hypothetical protein
MLDLSSLPRRAFGPGLEYNLERLGSLHKVFDHFLHAARSHRGADAVWLRRSERDRQLVSGIGFFESDSYASLLYGRLAKDGTVEYFNAGHPPPLWMKESGEVERLVVEARKRRSTTSWPVSTATWSAGPSATTRPPPDRTGGTRLTFHRASSSK